MKKIMFVAMVLLFAGGLFAQIEKSTVLPPKSHEITLAEKVGYSARYEQKFQIDEAHPNVFRMHADQVLQLLKQEGVAEFVMELGVTEEGTVTPVYYAADKNGNPLEMILEKTFPCPPMCDVQNNINAGIRTGALKYRDYK
jgi:hypothetical protein